jgi:hypothetical protein
MKYPFSAGRCACLLLGFFTLSTMFASDVGFYGIVKDKRFSQDSGAAPVLFSSGGFRFQCFVDSSEPNVITSAALGLPSGGSRTLSPDGSESYSFEAQFDSASAMNSVYGTGTYSLSVESENDIISFAQMTMPADAYPAGPFITNYIAAQSIDPAGAFTLYWSGFANGTASDFIQVQVRDTNDNTIFASSGQPGGPGALNGTNTLIVIPAGTLSPGQTYQGEIFFAKAVVSDTTSIPGAQGVLAFLARTSFNIQAAGSGQPDAIELYGVFKAQSFMQTNDAAPVFSTNEPPFQFQSFVDTSATNVVLAADVRLPGGTIQMLSAEDDGKSWSLEDGFSTQSGLDSACGIGTYTMRLSRSGSMTNVVPLNLPADAYPDTPQITNYSAAQSINPSNNFTLFWNPFTGGTSNDFIQVEIGRGNDQTVFHSSGPGEPGSLNGTSTSFQIPTGTLSPGETYSVQLMFVRLTSTDTTSIPGALGLAGFIKTTTASIRTTGTPFMVRLQVVGMVNGQFQFKFNSQPGRNYQVQWLDSLPNSSPSWGNLWFINATSSETVFTDTFPLSTQRFYRVEVQ